MGLLDMVHGKKPEETKNETKILNTKREVRSPAHRTPELDDDGNMSPLDSSAVESTLVIETDNSDLPNPPLPRAEGEGLGRKNK